MARRETQLFSFVAGILLLLVSLSYAQQLSANSAVAGKNTLTVKSTVLTELVLEQNADVRTRLATFFGIDPTRSTQDVARDLTVVLNLGALPPNSVGSGDITKIFRAAAKPWQESIQVQATVNIYYAYAAVGGELTFVTWDGVSRTWSAIILINNDGQSGHFAWYLDPAPNDDNEWLTPFEVSADLGGGTINTGRCFVDGVGVAGDLSHVDLKTIFMHALGHSLLLSVSNPYFQSLVADGYFHINAPLVGAGSLIPVASNFSGYTSHIEPVVNFVNGAYVDVLNWTVMSGPRDAVRCYPSEADALVVASMMVELNPTVNDSPKFWRAVDRH